MTKTNKIENHDKVVQKCQWRLLQVITRETSGRFHKRWHVSAGIQQLGPIGWQRSLQSIRRSNPASWLNSAVSLGTVARLLADTYSECPILDSPAAETICGQNWFITYITTIPTALCSISGNGRHVCYIHTVHILYGMVDISKTRTFELFKSKLIRNRKWPSICVLYCSR